MTAPFRNRALTPAELDRFGEELDALRARTVATLGQRDADYIRRIVGVGTLDRGRWDARCCTSARSRCCSHRCCCGRCARSARWCWACPRSWRTWSWATTSSTASTTGCATRTWTARSYEWDIAGTAENWRYTHNFQPPHVHQRARHGRRHRLRPAAHLPGAALAPVLPGAAGHRGGVRAAVRVGRGDPEPQARPLDRRQGHAPRRCGASSCRSAARWRARC